jgi:signal-transduction protein with cAMP-binding, CBS, and nucleotidyltransferase domain
MVAASLANGTMRQQPITNVMTTDLVSVDRSQPVSEVYHVLKAARFHHIPVLDGARPVGMISSTDILSLVYDIDGTDDRMLTTMLDHQFTIDDAMSDDLVTLPDTATVHDAAELLAEGSMHSVLVVDVTGELAGIVTTTDLVRFLRDL